MLTELLSSGISVLLSDVDVPFLHNPFPMLYRDADIEAMSSGWDDGSAYGWTEKLDDPSMGAAGRWRPSMRITAWNSGLWYARATHASLNLMSILAQRMATEDTWDQAAVRSAGPLRLLTPVPACRSSSALPPHGGLPADS